MVTSLESKTCPQTRRLEVRFNCKKSIWRRILKAKMEPGFWAQNGTQFSVSKRNHVLIDFWNHVFKTKMNLKSGLREPAAAGSAKPKIGDQKWTLYVRQANQPRRVLQIRVWQSLWLALLPRGGGLPGAQRARVPCRAAAIPRTAAAPSGSPRDGKAKCLRQLHIAPCAHTVKRECTTARAHRAMCACGGICIAACI